MTLLDIEKSMKFTQAYGHVFARKQSKNRLCPKMIPSKEKFHYMEVKTGKKVRKTERRKRFFFIYGSNFLFLKEVVLKSCCVLPQKKLLRAVKKICWYLENLSCSSMYK